MFTMTSNLATSRTSPDAPQQALDTLLEIDRRDSERVFRQMIDALPAAIYTTDATGRITHFNPACIAFSGRTPELGTDHWCVTWKLFHPDGRLMPHDECPMAVALKTGQAVRGAEAIAERPDGTRIWFEPYPTPLRDDRGEIIGGINMLVDITERKAADKALRDSERELSDFFETASIGLHWVGPDGVILRVNQAELDMLGYAIDEYLGHHIAEFHVDQPVIQDILARLQAGETLREYPARLRCKDGSIRHVLINSSGLFENGQFIHSRCFTHDVTERKAAEEVRARLAAIVESSDDAIISKDTNGIIRSWNKGAERLFGYSAEEAVGNPVTMLIPHDRQHEELEILERLRRGERVDHLETVRSRKDGSLLDVSLTISPVKDSSGRVIGISKISRDITQRKRHEQMLRIHKEQLEQELVKQRVELEKSYERLRTADRMAAVGTLASGLAHDISNVLLPLGARVDMLLTGKSGHPLDPDQKKELAPIAALVDHLREMARNLSLFSRDPEKEGTAGSTELSAWCSAVCGMMEASVRGEPGSPSRSVRFTMDIPAGLPVVGIAPHRLTQAVLNLVMNARDALLAANRNGSGAITVQARCAESNGANGNGNCVMLTVTDNGIGMDEQTKQRAPEPFFTTKHRPDMAGRTEAQTGGAGGSGLGLSLVYAIMERSGGRMEIESEPGQGTTIMLKLPIASERTC
jgi:PAS domain S-box-containing protein